MRLTEPHKEHAEQFLKLNVPDIDESFIARAVCIYLRLKINYTHAMSE